MKLYARLDSPTRVLAVRPSFVAGEKKLRSWRNKYVGTVMRSQMVTFPSLGDIVVTTLRSVRLVFPTTYKQRGNKVGLAEASPSEPRIRLSSQVQNAKLHSAFGV